LVLQDQNGVDVNVLLYLLWAGHNGRQLSPSEVQTIDRLSKEWRGHVVAPLRGIRRWLKDPSPAFASLSTSLSTSLVDGLRQNIKAAELEAERLQQEALYSHAQLTDLGAPCPPATAIDGNVRAYQNLLGTSFDAAALNVLLTQRTEIEGLA
jgi:uncharacterized protein (TIGR02444 family)